MASISETHYSTGFISLISSTLHAVADRIEMQAMANNTRRELEALSDRELADLGIFRANIPTIAKQSVRVAR